MSEPSIENHATCCKLSEVSKCAEMESVIYKERKCFKTIANIVIEEDMTSCKLTSGSISKKNSMFTVNISVFLLIIATMALIKAWIFLVTGMIVLTSIMLKVIS